MSATIPVRVDREIYEEIKERADARHVPIGQIIADLWEAEKRRRFWEEVNDAYLAMQSDPAVWQEEMALRDELAGTLMDGLDDTSDQ
jgi:hypothetical protein